MIHSQYILRAYNTLKQFTDTEKHHGLTLAIGPEENVRRAAVDVSKIAANGSRLIRPELDEMFKKYRGTQVLFTDAIFEVYKIMTGEQVHLDSLLALNTRGNLIELDGFLVAPRTTFESLQSYDQQWGTRHWNCAAASNYDIVTIALSGQRKTITTFYRGHKIAELCYSRQTNYS